MPAGRPTKYRQEYCQKIVEFMSNGASKVEFAVSIGVSKQSLYEWEEVYPEFSYAIKEAVEASQAWWEKRGREATFDSNGFNATSYIFNMKNRFHDDWKDRRETDHTSSDGSMSPPIPQYVIVSEDDV